MLEYQVQQCRLLPYLAACFVHHAFSMNFYDDYFRFNAGKMAGASQDVKNAKIANLSSFTCVCTIIRRLR